MLTLPKNKTVHNLVIGTGGKKYNESLVFLKNLKDNSDLIFHSPNLGFCYLNATHKKLSLTCYNEECKEEFTYSL